MKPLRRIIQLLALVLLCMSCTGNNSSEPLAKQDTINTKSKDSKGLPLDNLHRSRTSDTSAISPEPTSGVPLDNIHRTPDSARRDNE